MTECELVIKNSGQNLDYYLPNYHFSETHTIRIQASPQQVFRSIYQLDNRSSKIIKTLVRIRNFYRLLSFKADEGVKLQLGKFKESTAKTGFIELVESNNQEIVFGGVGQFWKPKGDFIRNLSPEEFLSFNVPNYCKIVWNFFLAPNPDGSTTLSTETRICCLGLAKLFFPPYWLIVRLFSGWIRIEMLQAIKKQAEGYEETCG